MPQLSRIVRVAIGITIFLLVLNVVGAREVAASFSSVDIDYVVGALALVVADALLRALNWMQLLRSFTELKYRQAASIYLAGGFYGSLIPSTVGKDTARAITVSRRTGLDLRVSAGSLITLNFLGLGAVGVLGVLAAGILILRDPSPFLQFNLALSTLLVLGVFILLFTEIGKWLLARFSKVTRFWPAAERFLKPLFDALLTLPEGRDKQLSLLAIGLLNQVIRVTVAVLLAYSLGLQIDWSILAAIAPIVAIVEMLPLSFMGIGIGQGAMVYFLDQFSVASSDAFALSTLIASIYIGQALVGGIPLLLDAAFGKASE